MLKICPFSCTYIAKSGRQSFLCAYFLTAKTLCSYWPRDYKKMSVKFSVKKLALVTHECWLNKKSALTFILKTFHNSFGYVFSVFSTLFNGSKLITSFTVRNFKGETLFSTRTGTDMFATAWCMPACVMSPNHATNLSQYGDLSVNEKLQYCSEHLASQSQLG